MEDEREELEGGRDRVDLTKGFEDTQNWNSWPDDMDSHEEVADSWVMETDDGAPDAETSAGPQMEMGNREYEQPSFQQEPAAWNAPAHSEDAAERHEAEVRYVECETKKTRNWIGVAIGAVLVVIGIVVALGAHTTGLPTSVSVPSATFGADFYTYIYQAVASVGTAVGELGTQVAQVAALAAQLCQGVGLLICAVGGATIAAGLRKS